MLKTMEPGKSKPTEDAENSDSDVKITECHVLPKGTIFVNPSLFSKPTGGANDSDNDVEIVECFDALGAPTLREKPPPTGEKTPVPPAMANATHIPLPLATPPWSPKSLLSGNEPIHMPPGMVLCIPCCLCQKPFYDIDLLKAHLGQHAIEIYQINLQSQVTGQPIVPQPFLNAINVHSSSEQSTQPFAPSFNHNHKHLMKRTQPPANESVECPICKIRLNSRQYLNLHNRRFHLQTKARRSVRNMEKPFVCKYCNSSYVHKANLNRHMRQKHDFGRFDHQKEPICRIPSPCSSAVSTSESTSTEASTEPFYAEPAVDYYPNSGAFIPQSSESTASTSESTSTQTSTELFKAEPAVDYYPNSGQFILSSSKSTASTSESTSFNAEPAVNYYPNSEAFIPQSSESRASTSESTSTQTSTELFKAEPAFDYITSCGEFILPSSESTASTSESTSTQTSTELFNAESVDSSAATESHEELLAKAAAYYCPPAKWAAMGLPFGKGYYIPMDPNKTYPARQDDSHPEFNNWISIEDMEKYTGRKDLN